MTDRSDNRAKLVLITGLSGSGKSSVAKAFEDMGYYTVDNLPLPLLRQFIARPLELVQGYRHIAVVADVRAPGFAEEFPALVQDLDRREIEVTLLFLEASDEILVRRFSETRRPHPLAPDRSVIAGIERERELMAELRGLADRVFDSTEWSVHDARRQVGSDFSPSDESDVAMLVSLESFGFKHGIPYGTDLLFDVRFLPNPYFVPGLRERTGLEAPVKEFLDAQEDFHQVGERLTDLLLFLLPRYRHERRSYLTVAVGCTGGRHRSVAVAEELARRLDAAGWETRVSHRDLERHGKGANKA
ncbi:MAG: RNase adapter RapZ [Acidobacteriota bacterium]